MPRTKSSCRISPLTEGYLDSMHRGALDLYPAEPPFEWLSGLNALIMPNKDLQFPTMRFLQRVLEIIKTMCVELLRIFTRREPRLMGSMPLLCPKEISRFHSYAPSNEF